MAVEELWCEAAGAATLSVVVKARVLKWYPPLCEIPSDDDLSWRGDRARADGACWTGNPRSDSSGGPVCSACQSRVQMLHGENIHLQ